MIRVLAALAFLLFPALALAQTSTLIQSGPTKAGHVPGYVTQGTGQVVVQDSGTAGGAGVGASEQLWIIRGTGTPPFNAQGTGFFATNLCDYDAPITNPGGYHYFCWSPNGTGGNGTMAYGASPGAPVKPFTFWINGVPYQFPFTTGGNVVGPNTTVMGDLACWNNMTGTLLSDCGALVFSNIGGTVGCSQLPAFVGDVNIPAGTCAPVIPDGSITSNKLGPGAASQNVGALGGDLMGFLPNAQLGPMVVQTGNIADGAVIGENVGDNSIPLTKLSNVDPNSVIGNPTGSPQSPEPMDMPTCSGATPILQWTNGSGFGCSALPASTLSFSPVRQTVMGGPVQTSVSPGAPSFWPGTSASLSITTQNVNSTYPLVVTAANGFGAAGPVDTIGYTAASLTWSGLSANSTIYLYVLVNPNMTMTPALTFLPPIYQYGGSPAVTAGQFTFNTSEMRGYLGNGSTAPQTSAVFLGYVTTGASTVTAAVPYAYNGRYDSGWTATLPTSTVVTFQSNIGVPPIGAVNLIIENTTTNNGFSVGDEIVNPQLVQSTTALTQVFQNVNQVGFTVYGSAWTTAVKGGGSVAGLTVADWKYKITASRGWGGS